MKKILVAIIALCNTTAYAQDTVKVDAKLTAATVYYGYGAELTHETKASVNSTVKQIVIKQLSTSIDENTIQISVPDNVTLLSHKYNVVYPTMPAVNNPLIKKMQDSIVLVNTDIRRNDNLIAIETLTLEKTGKLIEVVISNSGNKTVSSEEALKLINAYNQKIEKSKTTIFNLNELQALLNSKIDDLNKRITEAGTSPVKADKPYGQLILQVLCKNSSDAPIALSYFTKTAGWTPLYDIRVNSKTNDIKLVYKASVTQTTGIDWKQTKLTLSTGNPSLGGTAPILSAWYLQLYVPQLYSALEGRMAGVNVQNTIPSTYKDDKKLEEVVTAAGIRRADRTLGYTVAKVDPSTLLQHLTLNESQLNTNFEIDVPYDIESDGELHAVAIKEEKINAILKNYAVPKLDKDAYLLAEQPVLYHR